MFILVDTFATFLDFWHSVNSKPTYAQIEAWAGEYLASWPELLHKQVNEYAHDDLDWRQVARERIFPYLKERISTMRTAHRHLLKVLGPVSQAAQIRLGFTGQVTFVIYVGIGLGAGWATEYQAQPAVLFGLENIAELNWTQPETLSGLVAHELGHLYHAELRKQHGRPTGSGPWWDLYSEGFAQRCENLILGCQSWHMQYNEPLGEWLDWCQENLGWLAGRFEYCVQAGKSVNPFFGTWYEIQGHKQTGYYLGHEVIRHLEQRMSLEEIALLERI